jgi:hypothetical protein
MSIEKFIKKVCVQTAVYWGNPQDDGTGGKTFTDPVELKPPLNGVRWEETTQVITNSQGREIVSKAQILVCQDLDEEGYLFLGTLEDLDSLDSSGDSSGGYYNPIEIDGAYEIKRFDKTPMIKSKTTFVRKAYL